MRLTVADDSLQIDLPKRLWRAGWTLSRNIDRRDSAADAVLVGIELALDAARFREVRGRLGDLPLFVFARVPLPAQHEIGEHVTGLVLPAPSEPVAVNQAARSPTPRLAMVTTLGPPVGPPRRLHRQVVQSLRNAGVPGSLHGDMQERLTSTAAWSTPLSEAMRVAAAWGSDLRLLPMLGSLAARAAREQIGLARRAGLRLESRARWLLQTSESFAIEAMNRLAGYASSSQIAESLPSPAEALVSRALYRGFRDARGESTPAADALDALVLGLPSQALPAGVPPGSRGPGTLSA